MFCCGSSTSVPIVTRDVVSIIVIGIVVIIIAIISYRAAITINTAIAV